MKKLKKYIKETKNDGWVIVGWRALEEEEKIRNLERFNIITRKNNIIVEKSSHILPKSETPDEYHQRIIKEFKEMQLDNPPPMQRPVIIDEQKKEYLGIQPAFQNKRQPRHYNGSYRNKYQKDRQKNNNLCVVKINKSVLSKAMSMDLF